MLWWALLSLGLAEDPSSALRDRVEADAAAVAQARRDGASRAVLARLMRAYRASAEALEAAERARAQPDGLGAALVTLTRAVATGRRGAEARSLLVAELGEPSVRVVKLQQVLELAIASEDAALRAPLLLDVVDQARHLALVCAWDASEFERERRTKELRAIAAEQAAPGQRSTMDRTLDAARAREAARLAASRRDDAWRLHDLLREVSTRATRATESP